jgi:hypothetical protein
MRAILMILALGFAAPAWPAEDILQVLERSQRMQLDALLADEVPADDAGARVIQESFDRVREAIAEPVEVRLVVVRGPLLAVCLMGKVVAANVSLAEMSESERLFVLAHEMGHVVKHHWDAVGALYKQYIPGDVVKEKTDPIAGPLGRDASAQAHQHEFEADAFALRLIRRMGQPEDTPVVLFQHLPPVKASATHPSSSQRLVQLRQLR